ncbi:OLC1v1017799C1 [Oldenlandia corymbosa var. corymbosa]|uniref:mitogen-activated protein kinase kinase kinase n=1 Tax=Oldenlandia corymbosa var. corymbosa TaxID=529605 RepID=A0AAV1EAE7_OLDCO|nr:OLC1v1017799C1 [Oldenlandia corymbosa var. corymbosa]
MPPWLPSFSPSSKSSSSTSPSDSPQKDNSRRNKRNAFQKLIGNTSGNDEIDLQPVKSSPVSPEKGSRSSHFWSKAVPQPLPLPDLSTVQKNSNPGDHLPSPKEGLSKGDGDHPFSTAVSSIFPKTRRYSNGDVVSRSSGSSTLARRGISNELYVEGVGYDFGPYVPARSAPSSGFSSPAWSPQKYKTVDYGSVQASFGLDFPAQDRFIGTPSPGVSMRMMYSPDRSPLQSPKGQNSCMNTRKHSSAPQISCQKSHSETWIENNTATVHPLPLPPGASRSLQLPATHQYMDKSDALDASPVKGQWRKGRLIGRGTYGSVYVATNTKTGALCAMKEVDLIPDDSKALECIKQLEQEIKVLRHLKHPNVVQYLGCETIGDRFCIYLEYVHPGSINKYVKEHCGAMTECVVRSFTRHIVSGLAYLHSKKTIHRDIKGANLLVDTQGVVKLADFGLAKHLTGCANDLSLKGSPHWMAPEVLQAAMRKDATSELAYGVDIWGLGCTVIEMLTGKPPWSDYNGVQAMFNVLNKSPPIPDTLSPEGKEFLQLCFQRRPQDRPSAAVLLDHRFLRNPSDQELASCLQELSGVTLSDKQISPDCEKRKKDLASFLPNMYTKSPEQSDHSEISQTGPKVSDCGPTSHHSPRSTLEVPPSTSPPELSNNLNTACRPNGFDSLLEGIKKGAIL